MADPSNPFKPAEKKMPKRQQLMMPTAKNVAQDRKKRQGALRKAETSEPAPGEPKEKEEDNPQSGEEFEVEAEELEQTGEPAEQPEEQEQPNEQEQSEERGSQWEEAEEQEQPGEPEERSLSQDEFGMESNPSKKARTWRSDIVEIVDEAEEAEEPVPKRQRSQPPATVQKRQRPQPPARPPTETERKSAMLSELSESDRKLVDKYQKDLMTRMAARDGNSWPEAERKRVQPSARPPTKAERKHPRPSARPPTGSQQVGGQRPKSVKRVLRAGKKGTHAEEAEETEEQEESWPEEPQKKVSKRESPKPALVPPSQEKVKQFGVEADEAEQPEEQKEHQKSQTADKTGGDSWRETLAKIAAIKLSSKGREALAKIAAKKRSQSKPGSAAKPAQPRPLTAYTWNPEVCQRKPVIVGARPGFRKCETVLPAIQARGYKKLEEVPRRA